MEQIIIFLSVNCFEGNLCTQISIENLCLQLKLLTSTEHWYNILATLQSFQFSFRWQLIIIKSVFALFSAVLLQRN